MDEIISRTAGPLNFRLLVMPTMAALMGTLTGLRSARQGRASFLWTFITKRGERGRQFRSGLEDVGTVIAMAIIMDSAYQLIVLKAFYPVQLFLVTIGCAVFPYVLIRGLVNVLARGFYRRPPGTDACQRGGAEKSLQD